MLIMVGIPSWSDNADYWPASLDQLHEVIPLPDLHEAEAGKSASHGRGSRTRQIRRLQELNLILREGARD